MSSAIELLREKAKSVQDADFLGAILQQHYRAVIHGEKKVCLFGAGSAGKELAECLMLHDVTPEYFCDTKPQQANHQLLGIPVISYAQAKEQAEELVFVVATNNFKEQLKAVLVEDKIPNWCSLDDKQQFFYYLQIYKWHHELSSLDLEKIQQVYDFLGDKTSKEILISRINLLTSYADYGLFNEFIEAYGLNSHYPVDPNFVLSEHTPNYESYLYFNNDVLTLSKHEVLIDGGAFDGDTVLEFVRACKRHGGSYEHLFCIEADADNYKKLLLNTSNIDNLTAIQAGLWSEQTRLLFANSQSMFLTEARIVDPSIEMVRSETAEQNTVVDTVKIDDFAFAKKVTFIKMDIEGAELEALHGAEQIIKRDKPKLAISIYHKKADIYEIPLLIKHYCPEYKIYLRHFSSHLCETVMLAVV